MLKISNKTKYEKLGQRKKNKINQRIVNKLVKEIIHFKKLREDYDEKGDKKSSQESHLIWYYLFGALGKDSKYFVFEIE